MLGGFASDVEANKITVKQAEQAVAAHKQDVALQWGDDVAASTRRTFLTRAPTSEKLRRLPIKPLRKRL